MAGERDITPLSGLSRRITKGTTPTTLGHSFVARGVNFVKSEAITDDGRIDPSSFAFIDAKTHGALGRSVLEEGDVLFSMAGVYLGKTAVVPRSILPANTNQAVGIIRLDRAKASPRFIHYVLSSPECRALLRRSVAQSAQPNFNLQDIGSLPVPVVSLSEQRAIAHILGSLDDKIELNRRMNETLEGVAQALFKSWFVDFDPVRAKVEGRDPGLPKFLAELFPARLVDSELGEIPEAWRARLLGEVLTESNERVAKAKAPEYSSTNEGLHPRSDRFTKKLAQSSSNNKLIRNGYLVFGLSRRVLNFGVMRDEIGSVSAAYRVFAIDREAVEPDLLEKMMRIRSNYFYNAVSSSSREGQSVSSDALGLLRFVQPSTSAQQAYYRVTATLRARQETLQTESRVLSTLRDTLLPKLISGELQVKAADKFIGTAV